MPTKSEEQEGSYHEIGCTGLGHANDECIAWTTIWLPKKYQKVS